MDFITQLPPTASGHDTLLVFVDRLSKMTHLAATHGTDSAEDVARHFVQHVFRLHGLPESIVSDRDPKFTSAFWRECFRLLGTKLRLSTAFHPQTDGQTERMNRVVEEAVRHYISPDQRDWDEHLPLIEFAINNSKQASTGCSPFYLCGMKQPRVPATAGKPAAGKSPNAERVATEMRRRIERAKACLRDAQARQKLQADKKRSDFDRSAPEWQVGQYVMLSTRNMVAKPGQARKFLPRWAGPYQILEWINPVAVKIALPRDSRLHPVFHVSLLKPYKGPQRGSTDPPPPPPLLVEGELFYNVESIVGHRDVHVRGGANKSKRSKPSTAVTRREYLVKWEGYRQEHNTYEPAASLRDSLPVEQLIDAYERRLPADERRSSQLLRLCLLQV
jgi:hypothetical protein